MSDELVEAVARALWEEHDAGPWEDASDSWKKTWRRLARAAILAVLEGIREPSEEMQHCGDNCWKALSPAPAVIIGSYTIWQAMIDQLKAELE